jgi:hypothetical protein
MMDAPEFHLEAAFASKLCAGCPWVCLWQMSLKNCSDMVVNRDSLMRHSRRRTRP